MGVVGQAAGLFAVTNVDDVPVLALFFGRGDGRRGAAAPPRPACTSASSWCWSRCGARRGVCWPPGPVARALARWGHVLLPVVLIGIGVAILAGGGAFGL